MRYLALDVGGTSTRAVVVERDGRCVGYGTSGGGNPTASGMESAAAAIVSAARAAIAGSGDVAAVGVAIAGASGSSGERLRRTLSGADWLAADLAFESDVLATYHAGAMAADGYAIVVGTGAVAARLQASRIVATVDGLGWLLGDAGSGFWMGRRVVREVAAALDGRRPPTALTGLLLAELNIAADDRRGADGRPVAARSLLDDVYRLRPVELARFAQLAFVAAAAGDEAATGIVSGAADALAVTGAAVADRNVAGPIVLGGSILAQQPSIASAIVGAMRSVGVDGPVTTVVDGLAGAAVLTLRRAGVTVDDEVFGRVRSSLAALR